ncbi:hypothetical protein ACFRAR_19960 [Kitasatospora sp. NPDC056651]|uniref:hypothetical protein n=1 Tax=Kitasatospora sp. NPDC056651 TaxID=3345892 RepID=UPI0036C50DE6
MRPHRPPRRPRPRPRHAHGGRPLGAALGALLLAAATALAVNGSATAQPAPLDWIKNGDFRDPLDRGWHCDGEFVQTGQVVEGRPGGQDYAGCRQIVPVEAGTRYSFSAYMSGAYTFATISGTGTGTGELTFWADGPSWKSLGTTFAVGDVREVTVTFHGWYGQAPYQVRHVEMIGPMYPSECTPVPVPTAAPASTQPCMPRPSEPPTSPGPTLPTPTRA